MGLQPCPHIRLDLPQPVTRIVQRLMSMALLIGCVVVCAGARTATLHPLVAGLTAVTALIAGVFIVQTLKERRQ